MTRPSTRLSDCTKAEARIRLQQAESFLFVASATLNEDNDLATPGVAAALAVLAGIAASDAACCARLGERSRGQDHRQAVQLLEKVSPNGANMAKALRELLAIKDDSHYGSSLVSLSKAKLMVRRAKELIDSARFIVHR
ncbi:MAG: hypothetical protein ACKOI2_07825 [Actinomycetota bacterium]